MLGLQITSLTENNELFSLALFLIALAIRAGVLQGSILGPLLFRKISIQQFVYVYFCI